jgi:hypothetical protein
MTPEHILYIPTILLLGFLMGKLSFRSKEFTQTSAVAKESQQKRIVPRSLLVGSFLVFATVFIGTHLFELPASAKAVTQSLGGLEIFDRNPSFSSQEVYSRISSFPAPGLQLYMRFTHTIDIVFPLSLFAFLFLLGRFVTQRGLHHRTLARFVHALPMIWLGTDLLENGIVYYLLDEFPMKHNFLANTLGYITLVKFIFLVLSVLAPAIITMLRKQISITTSRY